MENAFCDRGLVAKGPPIRGATIINHRPKHLHLPALPAMSLSFWFASRRQAPEPSRFGAGRCRWHLWNLTSSLSKKFFGPLPSGPPILSLDQRWRLRLRALEEKCNGEILRDASDGVCTLASLVPEVNQDLLQPSRLQLFQVRSVPNKWSPFTSWKSTSTHHAAHGDAAHAVVLS